MMMLVILILVVDVDDGVVGDAAVHYCCYNVRLAVRIVREEVLMMMMMTLLF